MNHLAQPAPEGALPDEADADMQAFIDAHAAFHASRYKHNQFEHSAAAIITRHRERYNAAALRALRARLGGALREIEKGEGAFSRDQLTFANNVIERSKEVARTALVQPEDGK